MTDPYRLPRQRLTRAQVDRRAVEFLAEHHPSGSFPVPIEEIIEFGLEIAIVPGMALENMSPGIDAYLTPDLKQIDFNFLTATQSPARHRFSLAHEAGHAVLHPQVYSFFLSKVSSIGEYRDFMMNLDQRELGFIEWQANEFAGRVLVPRLALASRFKFRCLELDIDLRAGSGAWEATVPDLASYFDVSEQTIRIRCICDQLVGDD